MSARPFNVTAIRPAGYIHAHALDELVVYLVTTLGTCGHTAHATINQLVADAHNVVVGAHLLSQDQLARLPPETIIFNSEPLRDHAADRFAAGAYVKLLAHTHVWDYSTVNLSVLGHDRAAVIPFGFCAALVRMRPALPPGNALVFHGSITPRRQRLLDELRAAGIRLEVVFGEYGTSRDVRIFAARAVLNLHKTDDAGLFEPVRCFYPLINAVPVISEQTSDPAADAFRGAMDFVPGDQLVARIASLLADPDLAARPAAFVNVSGVAALAAAVDHYLARELNARDRTGTARP